MFSDHDEKVFPKRPAKEGSKMVEQVANNMKRGGYKMRTVERVCANCGQDYSPMLQAGGRLPRGFKKCRSAEG